MELGAVHRLSDGDPAMSPSCQRIQGNPPANLKATGRLGGGKKTQCWARTRCDRARST